MIIPLLAIVDPVDRLESDDESIGTVYESEREGLEMLRLKKGGELSCEGWRSVEVERGGDCGTEREDLCDVRG